jgi:hypothetical protein
MASSAEVCASKIRLVMILNDVSMRTHLFRELQMGFGFINAKPATVFGPVAVTPDELGEGWGADGRIHLDMNVSRDLGYQSAYMSIVASPFVLEFLAGAAIGWLYQQPWARIRSGYVAWHVLWPQGWGGRFDWVSALIALGAGLALFRFKMGVMTVVGAALLTGLALQWLR